MIPVAYMPLGCQWLIWPCCNCNLVNLFQSLRPNAVCLMILILFAQVISASDTKQKHKQLGDYQHNHNQQQFEHHLYEGQEQEQAENQEQYPQDGDQTEKQTETTTTTTTTTTTWPSTSKSTSSSNSSRTSKPNYIETSRQITAILDRFMNLGYDKRVRPNYGGPPVEVNVTMRILSISSVSEVLMDFTADFYFRQTWVDPRLAFSKINDIRTLYVGAEVSKKIWLPDTFFGNEKMAYFHEATTPNVFLRIDHSGEVYRSIRLTVTSSCPMNLQYFPMDRQRCTIEAESYGYNVRDIIYRWSRPCTAVERDEQISLPQFEIVGTVQRYRLEMLSSGTYSRLIAELHFSRRMGYYLTQIYIPSSLIVVISWVSFWLHRNASPARVQLGVTTVLTMTTLMSSTNAALPKISYIKSIDIFLGTCFIMVFAALLEYATVGYLGKRIAMRKAQMQHVQSQVQARTFARLQAQGAQGEPVPPSSSTSYKPMSNDSPIVACTSSQLYSNRANDQTDIQNYHNRPTYDAIDIVQQQQQQQNCQSAPEPPPRMHSSLYKYHRRCQCRAHNTCSSIKHKDCVLHQSNQRINRSYAASNSRVADYHRYLDLGQQKCSIDLDKSIKLVKSTSARTKSRNCECDILGSCLLDSIDRSLPDLMATNSDETSDSRAIQVKGLHQHRNQYPCHKCDHHMLHKNCQHHFIRDRSPLEYHKDFNLEYFRPIDNKQLIDREEVILLNPSRVDQSSFVATAAAATLADIHSKKHGLTPSTDPNTSLYNWLRGDSPADPDQATNRQKKRKISKHRIDTIFGMRPSDIDKYSRVVFPVCFICFQLMYWIIYLNISSMLETNHVDDQKETC